MRLGYTHCCFGKVSDSFAVSAEALPVLAASIAAVAVVVDCIAERLEPDTRAAVAVQSVRVALAMALIHNCSLSAVVAGVAAVKLAADYRCNML